MKKYGKSKEHRPNPIVTMGLFMDADGIPLSFDLYPGNQNEQLTLKPLETKVIRDFNCSEFIFCSDAGLGSKSNRFFNSFGNRSYVITYSLKKMKKEEIVNKVKKMPYDDLEKVLDFIEVVKEDSSDDKKEILILQKLYENYENAKNQMKIIIENFEQNTVEESSLKKEYLEIFPVLLKSIVAILQYEGFNDEQIANCFNEALKKNE